MGKFKEAVTLTEVIVALISSFIVSCGLFYLIINQNTISVISTNYSSFLPLSAAFIGFLITAFTIILAFPEEGRIKNLKQFEMYPELFYFFIISISSQVLVFIVAFIGLLFQFTDWLYLFIMIWALITSISFLILVVWVLKKMTDLYFEKGDDEDDNSS